MTTLLLVRHGRSTSNTAGTLAGRTPGISLDETGEKQAMALGERLRGLELAAAVCSPVQRCQETLELALASAGLTPNRETDERITECDYGAWSNRLLSELAGEPLWKDVQATPSSVRFPDGESMQEMSQRVVAAVTDWGTRDLAQATPDPDAAPKERVVLLLSHGDPIKAMLSHVLGQPFDEFQRIVVDPASVSIIQFPSAAQLAEGARPLVVATNTTEGQLVRRVPGGGPAPQLGGGLGSQQQ